MSGKEKSDNHLKKIVNGVLIYFIVFVIVTYITFWIKGSIPDTLVQFGLGGGAFEMLCTAIIEAVKKKESAFNYKETLTNEEDEDIQTIDLPSSDSNVRKDNNYYG